jgi:hypothetical protein
MCVPTHEGVDVTPANVTSEFYSGVGPAGQ